MKSLFTIDSQADACLQDTRYEIKCSIEKSALGFLENWIKLHPASFRTAYPDRIVNNIYYDTWDMTCLFENFTGQSSRVKCRLRWYGDDPECMEGVFEIKIKKNKLGKKYNHKITFPGPLFNLSYQKIRQCILEQASEETGILFKEISEPLLINRYSRKYFVSRDTHIRVTLDTGLKVYDQRFNLTPKRTLKVNLPEIFILECKFDTIHWIEIQKLLGDLPCIVTKSSKYALGVENM